MEPRISSFVLVLLMSLCTWGQGALLKDIERPVFLEYGTTDWLDEVMDTLTLEQQIGQLFMVAAYSNRGPAHEAEVLKLIKEHHVGGLIFFQGGPERQMKMTQRFQSASTIPLMLGMDAEWGLAMRLDSTVQFPYQMTLGAIRNDTIIYEMGREIGRHFRRIGMHVSFSPVVDVNNNPDNPVINYRSFGEDPYQVARKGVAYMKGLQREGILANAKHFPGHGDTDVDSHYGLPLIAHDAVRLDSIELFPFRQLSQRGLASMMIAHLHIPALDSTPGLPTTMSAPTVTGLLREKMGFEGLLFTDALDMKGIAAGRGEGEVALEALLAGNDVLLIPENVPEAKDMIFEAIADGRIDSLRIAAHCERILRAKAWSGLDRGVNLNSENLHEDLNTEKSDRLNQLLYQRALTLIRNEGEMLPLGQQVLDSTAYVAIGGFLENPFHLQLKEAGLSKAVAAPKSPDYSRTQRILKSVQGYPKVIVGLHGLSRYPKRNFGLSDAAVEVVETLAEEHEVILVHFGNPYALAAFEDIDGLTACIVAYEEHPYAQVASAQAIIGRQDVDGMLPVRINEGYPAGHGIILQSGRLGYALPEEVKMSALDLAEIDTIALEGIEAGAYPGCVVLVAKEGKIVYEKAFGHHTYENDHPLETGDIFDLASITKVAATAVSLIHLVDQGKVNVDGTLGEHLPGIADTSEYHGLVIRDILSHQAGLRPWIPFYTSTLKDGRLDPELYRSKPLDDFRIEVAEGVYLHRGQPDSIMTRILNTPLRDKRDYKYSDLGYYFMKAIIEETSGVSLDQFVDSIIYRPMGLQAMGYLPLDWADRDDIVPTEYDMYYRRQLLQGHVHDMGAAMQGGVGGHAGLFSNASDLAELMQMLLEGGHYAGEQLLNDSIIDEFTRCQFCNGKKDENRRGIAFDKPNRHGEEGPTCDCISYESYGHSGFTGTLSWADPEEDVVYVFLSNRIYPSSSNKKLQKMNIRTRIMEVIYMAIDNGRTLDALHSGKELGLVGSPSLRPDINPRGKGGG